MKEEYWRIGAFGQNKEGEEVTAWVQMPLKYAYEGRVDALNAFVKILLKEMTSNGFDFEKDINFESSKTKEL